MNDKQVVEYVRNLIQANLRQYVDKGDTTTIMAEIMGLDAEIDKNNTRLLEHIKGVKALLERAEQIIEKANC